MARLGGRDNAVTTHDATYYFQRLPKEHLKTAMVMEADRMRNLKLIDAEVATERQVVIQERRSVVDSKPLAILDELISAALYLNHSYRIPVIGWGPEIPKLSRELALEFYNRFYAPNNAILIVAGDVTEAEVRKLAQETFGRVKPRAGLTGLPAPRAAAEVGAARRAARPPGRATSLQRYYLAPSYKSAQGQRGRGARRDGDHPGRRADLAPLSEPRRGAQRRRQCRGQLFQRRPRQRHAQRLRRRRRRREAGGARAGHRRVLAKFIEEGPTTRSWSRRRAR